MHESYRRPDLRAQAERDRALADAERTERTALAKQLAVARAELDKTLRPQTPQQKG